MVPGEVILAEGSSSVDDPKVLCLIKDVTSSSLPRWNISLPGTTSARDLYKEVANQVNYELNSFSLVWLPMGDDASGVDIFDCGNKSLMDIGLKPDKKRNTLQIQDKDGIQPVLVGAVGTSATEHEMAPIINVDDPSPVTSPISDQASGSSSMNPTYDYSYALPVINKSDTGFVGLVNQAMTCYLNSLLQTLFMTPEFRNAVYRWKYDGRDESSSSNILYQLQRLFSVMQTSKKRAVETMDITRSFGWDSSEVWQQHDVQELCRVMFDALEKTWKKTDQHNLINDLYQGQMKDYVKCLECGYESARTDTYLDVPLVIRPFGSDESYSSVEEALKAFVSPETLNDTNQYFCERCNKKNDAHKGLKFISFPYLLTMQLKRFDFDYTTMHRIKLNDKMTFPDILDLNSFIDEDERTPDMENQATEEGTRCVPNNKDDYEKNSEADESEKLNEAASMVATNNKNERERENKGPYIYELFSIMVHSGSAAGGHYYAYIKSFTDGLWYCFNDQHVTRITYDDIRKTYGGSVSGYRGCYSSAYSSSTNAYMLMYRQIDSKRNKTFVSVEDFPDHLVNVVEEMKQVEESEKKQREAEKNTCKIKLFGLHPETNKLLDAKLEIHKDKTLLEATEVAHKLLGFEDVVPVTQCRLVKYDEYNDALEKSYEGEEKSAMGELLGGVKSQYLFDLFLETRKENEEFQVYKYGGVTLRVSVIDLEKEVICNPITIRAYLNMTVQDLRSIIATKTGLPQEGMRMVLEKYYNDLRLLAVPSKTLQLEGFAKSNKVYVECCDTEDSKLSFPESKLHQILDRHANTIRLFVTLPALQPKLKRISNNLDNQLNAIVESLGNLKINNKDGKTDMIPNHDRNTIESKKSPATTDRQTETATISENETASDKEATVVGASKNNGTTELSNTLTESGSTGNSETLKCDSENTNTIPTNHDSSGINTNASPLAAASDTCLMNTSHVNQETQTEKDDSLSEKEFKEESDNVRNCANMDTEEECIGSQENQKKWYFNPGHCSDPVTESRVIDVQVDKRITLKAFKLCLEQFVGVSSQEFKIYRVYANNQEFEIVRLTDTLQSHSDEGKVSVKLGRALKKGECRVKVFLLSPNSAEPCKFLFDWVLAKGQTVRSSKLELLDELKQSCNIDIPLNRLRLRKKSWKNPAAVYVDNQVYDEDIPIFSNWELFIEILQKPEEVESSGQLVLFVRRWLPSQFRLEPFQEVILDDCTVVELRKRVSDVSGLPADCIDFAKGRGAFPSEISLLEMQTDLEWNPQVTTLNSWPLYITDDGAVIYYRDSREELTDLTEEQKKEIQKKENARLTKTGQKIVYSPRKERALKIYTDIPSSP
ncbi:ubiquitin carboxyl-terminal hydrolase 47-like [Anneissia japonica]|uniref:ubiquitin carboxyl-terminal hydrolase 47-like n=1 Tax=Anneissia japonica TaxID=1529436 RepID=UPI001425A588|nr:ubiquitin carboxyl-terminal hydrolase 47-like [Anneissia japonica]